MQALLTELRDRAFPTLCHACGRRPAVSGTFWRFGLLCSACAGGLRPDLEGEGSLARLRLLCAFEADPVVSSLIKGWKYSGRDAAVRLLAAALGDRLLASDLPRPWRLVPVPMPIGRRLLRGFNQSERLAAIVADRLGCARPLKLLARSPLAGRQAGRSRLERHEWAAREYRRVAEAPPGGSLILVDDLCTTGATLTACAAALRDVEARIIAGLILMRVPQKGAGVLSLDRLNRP